MMTFMQAAGVIAMLATALSFAIQAVVVRGDYGWKYRPWYNRMFMAALAILLAARALGVLRGGLVVNPLWLATSSFMAAWSTSEVLRIVTESWQRKTAMLELGRYVETNLRTGSPVPFYELFRRRR